MKALDHSPVFFKRWRHVCKLNGVILVTLIEGKRMGPDNCWCDGFVCKFDLILYVPSTIFHLKRDGSSWVEQVLS